ncbi:hypothetical protein [Streptomyces vietnamensis]|uniref:hypothetical protein n=1 Tax=Streptomyces vietnamensis TaxID=362257 RepID=UPI003436CF2B
MVVEVVGPEGITVWSGQKEREYLLLPLGLRTTPEQLDFGSRVLEEVGGQSVGNRWGHADGTRPTSLGKGEVKSSREELNLAAGADNSALEVDIVG